MNTIKGRGFECFAEKSLPNGKVGLVYPLSFGRARLGVGPAGSIGFDDVF
jgi:hypothetical protein